MSPLRVCGLFYEIKAGCPTLEARRPLGSWVPVMGMYVCLCDGWLIGWSCARWVCVVAEVGTTLQVRELHREEDSCKSKLQD